MVRIIGRFVIVDVAHDHSVRNGRHMPRGLPLTSSPKA